ncbi:MAG: UPF0262 family protein, partial [Pseudomonadota bacterium]
MADEADQSADESADGKPKNRIVKIDLDERSLARATADIEYERKVAIYDLLEVNMFQPEGAGEGPFELYLSIVERRLVFDVRREGGDQLG